MSSLIYCTFIFMNKLFILITLSRFPTLLTPFLLLTFAAARVVLKVDAPELDDVVGETANSDQQTTSEDIIKVQW